MANLYTKTGDRGETGLVGGARVRKDSPRVDCYGTVDEGNAMLGLAYALTKNEYIKECLDRIQQKLFLLGAELASDEEGLKLLGDRIICEKDIEELEGMVDRCTLTTGVQTEFVIPGVNEASAALHAARTIVRRAERLMIRASGELEMRETILKYINRLSDAVYALARLEETAWQKEHKDSRHRCWPPKRKF